MWLMVGSTLLYIFKRYTNLFLFHDADYICSQTPRGCLKSHLLHNLVISSSLSFWSINFSAHARRISPFLSDTSCLWRLCHCLSSDLHLPVCLIQSFSCPRIARQSVDANLDAQAQRSAL